ncbi:MAG: hypothetical protein II949_07640 [Prevotella sp.]|nr:hypothetical protein [Prevotella sp.]
MEVSGAKAYTAALDATAETITCTEITDGKVPAGAGVLIYGDASATVTLTPTTDAAALKGNGLKATTLANGALAAKENGTYYVLSGNTFKTFTGTAFTANKAYFEAPATARPFTIVFGGETTGINTVLTNGADSNETFNLAGQRVAAPQKGLYIVGGKKVIVK